ncbi:hypothetical protein [Paenibacillus tyrfis]|uniref:hypothetical protein n=1 Tax=Paenibacillus tyrfis TaxID=1501230 RepID=UPI00209DA4B8|nr:hypothetical protein [Paenibacillus tyrfis]MCP1312097.1 hypothetical protein [Paenibacillus tyrfis]
MAHYRLSAKVEFSPEAEKLYLDSKNKSEFILTAIEFYAHHGKAIQEDLTEIKKLLLEMKEKGISVPLSLSDQEKTPDVPETPKKEMSEEEKAMQESIMSTLVGFLGEDDDE